MQTLVFHELFLNYLQGRLFAISSAIHTNLVPKTKKKSLEIALGNQTNKYAGTVQSIF
jgi:hypothetical protein